MFYLGHVTGPASNIMPPSAAGISTEHLYTSMVGVPESIDQREQRRFASPVWADDAYELARIYAHIDVIQRVVSPVRDYGASYVDDGIIHGSPAIRV